MAERERSSERSGSDRRAGDNRGDKRGGRRGRRNDRPEREEREQLDERVVDIVRTAKVVKGGRRFAFRACVVVGDRKGRVGVGIGKAREVPDAIRKAGERARKAMVVVPMLGSTIPHQVQAQFGAGEVLLKPANPGTGVIAGRGVRPVIEACGINDILSKSLGSTNVLNVVQATFVALQELQDFRREAQNRGVDVQQLAPFWFKEETHG